MNEKFSTLFLDSLKDGSYNIGLKDKISEIRMLVHNAQEGDIYEWRSDSHHDEPPSQMITQDAEEIARNIAYDSTLSQSHGNPPWYPPVPKHKIPKSRQYTSTQIAQIKMSRDIDFIENNIMVSKVPLSSEDIGNEFTGLGHMNPSILAGSIMHEAYIDITTGFVKAPSFAYPEITNCVAYMVNIYVDPRTHKQYLSYIYVYKKDESINLLLNLLRNIKVENMDDLRNSGECLVSILLNKSE